MQYLPPNKPLITSYLNLCKVLTVSLHNLQPLFYKPRLFSTPPSIKRPIHCE